MGDRGDKCGGANGQCVPGLACVGGKCGKWRSLIILNHVKYYKTTLLTFHDSIL